MAVNRSSARIYNIFGVNPCFSCSASPGVLSVGSQGCALEDKITWGQATESRSGRKFRNHQEMLKSLTGLGQQDKRETVCLGCFTNMAVKFLFLGMFSQMLTSVRQNNLPMAFQTTCRSLAEMSRVLSINCCIIHAPIEQLPAPARCNKPLPCKTEFLLRSSLSCHEFHPPRLV